MAKIGLIDVDGHNWPNLPLMKLSAYHKAKGDTVEPWIGLVSYDRVYMSKVFTASADIDSVIMADEVVKGGTGYGADSKLPAETEHIYPDYSLYPQYTAAYGFLTRGCPRGCPFCVVSDKEGRTSRQVADLGEFWRGQREIKLLDPNLLACAEHEAILQQLIDSGAWVDFTQGLDARLLTDGNIRLLQRVKLKMVHFAWDRARDSDLILDRLRLFKAATGIDRRRACVYVLVNFDTDFEFDLYRVNTLRDMGYWPYVMIYDKASAPERVRHLQRYVNNRAIFQTVPKFEDYRAKRGA